MEARRRRAPLLPQGPPCSSDYVCFDVGHASVSNKDTALTLIIILNYVIFLNYYYRRVSVLVMSVSIFVFVGHRFAPQHFLLLATT
jgi:hypothetical protein